MKKILRWTTGTAVLMIGCPWLAVTFAGSAGMAVCFILFFTVNPAFSLLCGLAAGKALKKLWFLPFTTAALFLLGAWTFFSPLDGAFLFYAAIYLGISLLAMTLRATFKRLLRR